jgi:hypothetical protein
VTTALDSARTIAPRHLLETSFCIYLITHDPAHLFERFLPLPGRRGWRLSDHGGGSDSSHHLDAKSNME